jgi:ubiquinone/menaquinone biosynthesis C-methylase UbiE
MQVEAAADPFTELMLDYYRAAAPRYDDWAGGVHLKAAARLAQLAAIQPNDVVVDAGCGTGLVARVLAAERRRVGRILGVDMSLAMLEVAETNRPRDAPVTFGRGLAEHLVLRDKTVDVVILGLVLSLTARPDEVLLEARRVLRPGGRVVISETQRSLYSEVDQIFFAELNDLFQLFPIPARPESHSRLGEPQMMRRLLEQTGFKDIRTSSMVVGNHVTDAHAFIELMRDEGPWTHSMVRLLGPGARARLEHRLTGTVRFSEEGGPFLYHRPYSFAVAQRI